MPPLVAEPVDKLPDEPCGIRQPTDSKPVMLVALPMLIHGHVFIASVPGRIGQSAPRVHRPQGPAPFPKTIDKRVRKRVLNRSLQRG
jgi:hypothetical protein